MQTRVKDMLLAAGLVGLATASHHEKRQTIVDDFDWSSITPSKKLEYHDCYEVLQCARLELPLDRSGRSNSSEPVAIAIVTLPASVPKTDPSFGGTILLNPGGPGGAGTTFLRRYGEYLRSVVDGEKHYELLGFDPRGVGLSTPRADCYENDLHRSADELQALGIPPVGSGPEALGYSYQRNVAISQLCGQHGNNSIFNHMSTATVAEDMLDIIDRVDELEQSSSDSPSQAKSEKPKLKYIGTSYGTVLGNVFASMFPDRVGRMVIDGVTDPDDFMTAAFRKSINDFDNIVDHFYQTCFDAGSNCPLKQDSDESPSSIKERVDTYTSDLEASPIPAPYNGRTRSVTSLLVRNTISDAFYNPVDLYAGLAAGLALSMAGNHTMLFSLSEQTKTELDASCADPNAAWPPSSYSWQHEASLSVACGDASANSDERDLAWAKDTVDFISNQSSVAGEWWSSIPLACIGWKYKPDNLFTGPFSSTSEASYDGGQNATGAPLLILSTRYDPITPLRNAVTVSESHIGSAVVVQESLGHTALLTSTSKCTAKIVKEYFATGKVPESLTTCEADCEASIPAKLCKGLSVEL